ncbi:Nif3-like dinuclear metal center hexameric protein [uncultured Bifidobacterium sp.]|uniref:Nif3-like dinuclear metal center hexameric protein n=1 Tax=uncultured Bifidobacterium sp. TaxID=165187 RepID=UPI0026186DFD|nr:Nif3-like dinuclear metal center hexameric protein [uncultured Bifidobacterium sp.]
MVRLSRVVEALEVLYPLRWAEDWDHPGLIVGMGDDEVHTIAFAVDPTAAVVDAAIERGADLLVCHHPLLFRSVHEVSGLSYAGGAAHGSLVAKLYRAGCGLWVGHTNADVSFRGVGQAAADAFGLVDQHPLVPVGDAESRSARDETPRGVSQNRAEDGSSNAHAVDDRATFEPGLGRVGRLAESMTLSDFARRVAEALPHTELGVQVAGDPSAMVSSVAVVPGSGDSLFDEVRASGADVYVTSDLRHHPATDAIERARYEAGIREGGDHAVRPMLINTPHSAIESLWLDYALDDVPDQVARLTGERPDVFRVGIPTDPWTLVIR